MAVRTFRLSHRKMTAKPGQFLAGKRIIVTGGGNRGSGICTRLRPAMATLDLRSSRSAAVRAGRPRRIHPKRPVQAVHQQGQPG